MELLDPAECSAANAVPAKKLAVLKAALRLFLEQGFGATSMDAIAREAGVSKATLYAHVKSKEELFAAITATCAEQLESLAHELALLSTMSGNDESLPKTRERVEAIKSSIIAARAEL